MSHSKKQTHTFITHQELTAYQILFQYVKDSSTTFLVKHMIGFFILCSVLLFISLLILVIEQVYKKYQDENDGEWNFTVHIGAKEARNSLRGRVAEQMK